MDLHAVSSGHMPSCPQKKYSFYSGQKYGTFEQELGKVFNCG
jgi:hypothetical protein